MLSRQEIYTRLTDRFICLRLDWEQGNHFKDRFGFILGTGDQMILDPQGKVIPAPSPEAATEKKRSRVIFGRNGCDTTAEVLDSILRRLPKQVDPVPLTLDWFFWSTKKTRRLGGSYPASPEAIAGFARLPMAVVHGPLPGALQKREFLQDHVRQFIWVRGRTNGPSRIEVRRVRDGLPDGLSTELSVLEPDDLTTSELGRRLDEAWLNYMKDRPRVAQGYLDNPHGKWMRGIAELLSYEDEEVRQRARAGTLRPPGRK